MAVMLALDCSGKNITLAVCKDGKTLHAAHHLPDEPQSSVLLKILDESFKLCDLKLNQIDVVLFCHGPGSFTSLRVGLATIKGLFAGMDIQFIPVSSLLFRCVSANIIPVKSALSLGRGRWAVGHLTAGGFSEQIVGDEAWQQGVKIDPDGHRIDDDLDGHAFLKTLELSDIKEVSLDGAKLHYLLDPDIG